MLSFQSESKFTLKVGLPAFVIIAPFRFRKELVDEQWVEIDGKIHYCVGIGRDAPYRSDPFIHEGERVDFAIDPEKVRGR